MDFNKKGKFLIRNLIIFGLISIIRNLKKYDLRFFIFIVFIFSANFEKNQLQQNWETTTLPDSTKVPITSEILQKIKIEKDPENIVKNDEFFKLKDEMSHQVDENIDLKTDNVKLRHQVEKLTAEVTIMKSTLEKKTRILALRNAEIALLDPERNLLE